MKTKKCYFKHKIEKLFTIQVDLLKKLYANFNNLLLTKSIISKAGKETISYHTKLSQPLNAFFSFNINWRNTLSANNSSTHASSIFISSSPHSPLCNNKLLAIASLNNNITTWACYNSSWPNSTQACLTLLAFLATIFLPNTNISITSNDSSFIQILENTARTLTHILASLDKSHYTFILLTIKAIITPLNLSFNIDKEFKHTGKPDNLMELDIKPQEFLFNRFISCLLSSPCTYHLRTIIKDNLKIINSLKWANQNRIKY